ncbi:Iron-uptake system permease protein FeuB [Corynebacterium gerontici]|uniref:Iron-uptake system permease protein FeuB n=2 Tax=Corynebacterium gerontici TaxID=2079234 RepID=A0A3G6IZ76_9CORY|nr:Iron-uptake system permease protein FeuB [Corynebacterium gerontici]
MIRSLNPRFAMATMVVAGLLFASLMVGEYNIFSPGGWEMMMITRIPRTIALVLSGAALAMSGLLMQLLTQNRFVEPTTTGTTEWAGLGLLISLIFFPEAGVLQRMVMAVLCSFIGTMVFFAFLRKVSLKQSLVVPIMGIMLGAVVGALSTFLALEFDALQSLAVWFQGSFTSVYQGQYEVLWLVLLVVIAVFWGADYFTAVGLGQDIATNLGVPYQRLVFFGTALIALATGVVTVVAGNLPFLGLIVPNIVSRFRGDNLQSNLSWVCLLGIGIVTASDLLARTIISPFEIPVSVVLGIIGAVFFVILIVRSSNER